MLGLETALAVTLTELVEPGYLELATAVERLTAGPARCRRLGGHGGPVAPGAPANLARGRPGRRLDGRPGQAGQPGPQHPLPRPPAPRLSGHTLLRGLHRPRRTGDPVSRHHGRTP